MTGAGDSLDLLLLGGAGLGRLGQTLAAAGHSVRHVADPEAMQAALDAALPSALLIEAALAGPEARLVHDTAAICPVIVVDAAPSLDRARQVLRAGAADYLPLDAGQDQIAASLGAAGLGSVEYQDSAAV